MNDWYNDVSEHFEDPWLAAHAADERKQKELFDIDAPWQSKKVQLHGRDLPRTEHARTLLWKEYE